MKNIWLLTEKNGEVLLHKHARPGITVDEICEIAENEVYGGFADYTRVTVDGEVYAEYES